MAALDGAGYGPGDVVHVTEHVTVAGLAGYAEASGVRGEVFGVHEPAVTTVVVEGLADPSAVLEVGLHAVRGAQGRPRRAGRARTGRGRVGASGRASTGPCTCRPWCRSTRPATSSGPATSSASTPTASTARTPCCAGRGCPSTTR
ncbi:hypothetical protein [Actinomadura sp. CNU-125]|uniref:hypothetical protein n=1 Tax=Actinomadura sp. CNU-125 TaxID=1904961 RepID=UPI0021CCE139|nr:hypothetical protein [Actinomadura sp. CNU-125]